MTNGLLNTKASTLKTKKGAGGEWKTYLHSPGLSQKPCCSSHPGKQIAVNKPSRERHQHQGRTPPFYKSDPESTLRVGSEPLLLGQGS